MQTFTQVVQDRRRVPTQVILDHHVVGNPVVRPHSRTASLGTDFLSHFEVDQYRRLRMGRLPSRI
jgi:hypothetical protein